MSLLKNFAVADSTQDQDQDTLPVAVDRTLDTGVYDVNIELAYLRKSGGGATGLTVVFQEPGGPARHEETFWIASGDKKGNKTYYVDKDGNHRSLPGLVQMDTLAQLVTGQPLNKLDGEEKVIKLYDFEAKKELPTTVPVITDLIGKDLKIGVVKIRENKRVQQGDDWVNSDQERFHNEVDKFFSTDGHTLTEAKAGEPATFIERWKERNQVGSLAGSRVIDRYKAVESGPNSPAAKAASPDKKDAPKLFT